MAAAEETPAPKRIVEIKGLKKRFGANEVLKGIDLEVGAGEVIAIIGKSGSGKSTLLRCINGLEVFDEGTLTVDGQPLLHGNKAAMRALRQRVGMIFQSFNLFPHLSVGRNVMLAPTLVKKAAAAAGGEQAQAAARARRPGREVRRLAGPALGRPAAARRDRARAGDGAGRAAVRRDHLGARPRAGRRGAARRRVAGSRRHDPADGHARDELRAQGLGPGGLHARRPHPRDGPAAADLRRAAERRSCSQFLSALDG